MQFDCLPRSYHVATFTTRTTSSIYEALIRLTVFLWKHVLHYDDEWLEMISVLLKCLFFIFKKVLNKFIDSNTRICLKSSAYEVQQTWQKPMQTWRHKIHTTVEEFWWGTPALFTPSQPLFSMKTNFNKISYIAFTPSDSCVLKNFKEAHVLVNSSFLRLIIILISL